MLGGYAGTEVLIENSEFGFNGACDGYSHGVYFGAIDKLTLSNSYVHDTCIGHNVKTRSRITYLLGNRITDEAGDPSFDIDISGGRAYVIGNMIEKSVKAENPTTMLNFYTVRDPIGPHELYVINNTFVSNVTTGKSFVFVRSVDIPTFAKVVNNIFVGSPRNVMVQAPNAVVENNLRYPLLADAKLANIAGYDYRLTADSEAINAGINPGSANGVSLMPTTEYLHTAKGANRTILGPELDIGAFEFTGTPTRLYPLPTLNFTSKFSTTDSSSDISWDTNGSSCVGSDGTSTWVGAKSTRGTFNTGLVTKNTVYTLVCTGRGGATTKSITVTPPPAMVVSFTSSNLSVPKGTGAYLNWSVFNAKSCLAGGAWSGPVALSGAYDTGPLATTKTYEITCTGLTDNIIKKSVTITITDPLQLPGTTLALHLKAERSELSPAKPATTLNPGWASATESVLTPAVGPQGTLIVSIAKDQPRSGDLVGIAEFVPTPSGEGVHFGPGGQQPANAGYYRYILSPNQRNQLINENGGEVRATIVGRWDMDERNETIPKQNQNHFKQVIFSTTATDGVNVEETAFLSFDTAGKELYFGAKVPGAPASIKYPVPQPLVDALMGKGKVLRVRLQWDGSTQRLFVNDNLVLSSPYTKQPITWTPTKTVLLIGATATNFKLQDGFHALMDILDDISFYILDGSGGTVTDPGGSTTQPPPPPPPGPTTPVTASLLGALSVSGDFEATTNCPATLPEGQSCQITIKFIPSAEGDRSGTLTFTDPVTRALRSLQLRGRGVRQTTPTTSTSTSTSSTSNGSNTAATTPPPNIPNTSTGPDTARPTAPGGVIARITSTQPYVGTITWNPSTDNVGVAGYQIFRKITQVGTTTAFEALVQIGTTAETTFADSNLVLGRRHDYNIRAYDAAGNVSPNSRSGVINVPATTSSLSEFLAWLFNWEQMKIAFQSYLYNLASIFTGKDNVATVVLSVSSDSVTFDPIDVGVSATKIVTITLTNIPDQSTPPPPPPPPTSSNTGSGSETPAPDTDPQTNQPGPDVTDGDQYTSSGGSASSGGGGGGGFPSISIGVVNNSNTSNISNTSGGVSSSVSSNSSTSGSSASYNFTRNLNPGTSGEDVRALQRILNAEGFSVTVSGQETTYFGPITAAALARFQEKYRDQILTPNGLTRGTGILGPATIRFILSRSTTSSTVTQTVTTPSGVSVTITRSLSYGSRGSDVTTLQNYLISKGYLEADNNTGFYGNLTKAAVRQFQCTFNIVCSGDESSTGWGVIGPKTRGALK